MSTAVPTREDIIAARRLIRDRIRRTPVIEVDGIRLKLEQLQHAGSFKPRGAFLAVLSQSEPPTRLVAASGGNHGLAVAHVGRALGIPTEIFVPEISSPVKIAGIRRLGADVRVGGADYAAALTASLAVAERPGTLAVHAYDGPYSLAGQGTLALELSEQAPDADQVLVAVGGGGLIGGIAAWYTGRAQVIGVEPSGCPTLHDALGAGRPVPTAVGGLAADALGASRLGGRAFDAVRAAGVESVLVEDAAIAEARRWLWQELRLVVEPAGAAALAALRSGAWQPPPRSVVAVVLCGANTDPSDLIPDG